MHLGLNLICVSPVSTWLICIFLSGESSQKCRGNLGSFALGYVNFFQCVILVCTCKYGVEGPIEFVPLGTTNRSESWRQLVGEISSSFKIKNRLECWGHISFSLLLRYSLRALSDISQQSKKTTSTKRSSYGVPGRAELFVISEIYGYMWGDL